MSGKNESKEEMCVYCYRMVPTEWVEAHRELCRMRWR